MSRARAIVLTMSPLTEGDARLIHSRTQHVEIHDLSREYVESLAWWAYARSREASCARPVLA